MKKKLCAVLILLLLFCSCFGGSALAEGSASELSHITDAAGLLSQEQITELESLAAQASREGGVELYVIAVQDYQEYSNSGILGCAEEMIDYFSLGSGAGGNALVFLVSVEQMEYAVAVRGDYAEYCFGKNNTDLIETALLNGLREGSWYGCFDAFLKVGADVMATASAHSLTTEQRDQSFNGLSYPENSYLYGATDASQQTQPAEEPVQTPSPATSMTLGYATDTAGILTEDQVRALEEEAAKLSESLNFPIYLVVIQNYRDYTSGDVNNCATDLYTYYDLGVGPNRDGLLLLMSMQERDYSIITHGYYGNYCFGDHNLNLIEDAFLDNFRNNDWMGGFRDYLAVSGDVLRTAAAHGLTTDQEDQKFPGLAFPGNTYRYGVTGKMPVGLKLVIGLGVPSVIALAVCGSFRAQMKTAKERTTAEEYVVPGSATLRVREDRFTHRSETRTPIQSSSGSSGRSSFGGGGGGGFSGHSGKF